jgi:ABC-type amino acid transport substrate-binding protein
MTFRTLMALSATVLLAIGFALCATPIGFSLFYDGVPALTRTADSATDALWVGVAFMRLFGVALVVLGFVAWFARAITSPEAQNAVARGLQYGGVVGFFIALAQEVAALHNVAGALIVCVFLGLVASVVYWRVQHAKADPYGAISVRV